LILFFLQIFLKEKTKKGQKIKKESKSGKLFFGLNYYENNSEN
jgi:hypothetical protein